MAANRITELIDTLTPQEEEVVREFIYFLKSRDTPSPFAAAVDEFINEHPGLLRRLAQ